MALTGRTAHQDDPHYGDEPLPALTGKMQARSGWRQQAANLSLTHSAVGMAALAVTDQARPRAVSRQVEETLAAVAAVSAADVALDPHGNGAPAARPLAVDPRRDEMRTAIARILNTPRTTSRTIGAARNTASTAPTADAAAPSTAPVAPVVPVAEDSVRLERELAAAREDVARYENERRSLQASLDLLAAESARQSRSLAETDAAAARKSAELTGELGRAREALLLRDSRIHALEAAAVTQTAERMRLSRALSERDALIEALAQKLEQMQAERDATAETLRAARDRFEAERAAGAAERDRLARVLDDGNAAHGAEVDALNAKLAEALSRAAAAERRLAEAQQSWLAGVEDNSAAERRLAEMIDAWTSADKKLAQLKEALAVKDRQIGELEQSRAALIEGANTLLDAVRLRDTALIRAEERIAMLGERIAQFEAESVRADIGRIAQAKAVPPASTAAAAATAPTPALPAVTPAERAHDAAAPALPAVELRSPQMLLADTISFGKAA